MKNSINAKIIVIILMAVLSPLFNLSCFEGKKDDSGSQMWTLLSIVDSMSGYIRVYNESSYQIDMVYITPVTSTSLGNDLLQYVIFSDEYEIFKIIEGNYYVINS